MTCIGAGLVVEGDVIGDEDVSILGRVHGRVECRRLLLQGELDGDASAADCAELSAESTMTTPMPMWVTRLSRMVAR